MQSPGQCLIASFSVENVYDFPILYTPKTSQRGLNRKLTSACGHPPRTMNFPSHTLEYTLEAT